MAPIHRKRMAIVAGRPLRGAGVAATGWLLAASVFAADDVPQPAARADVLDGLTRPSSSIGFGVGPARGDVPASGQAVVGARDHLGAWADFDLRGAQFSYQNPDDDKTRWRLSGQLGLRPRSISGEYGRQGWYRVSLRYDELQHIYSDSYQTPLRGAGGAALTLPAGFVQGATPAAMPLLEPSMQAFELRSHRQRLGVDVRYWLDTEWELRLWLHNDVQEGTRPRGAEFGSNGGNARSMLLPEPLDAATQQVEASVAYSGSTYRFVLAYKGSMYRNHVNALTWQNPYSSGIWTGGATGLPAGYPLAMGQTGVAPDNDFHQLSLNGAYDFSSSTRLTLSASRGRMTQNEAFLPYTITPGLVSTSLPRESLDGRVETRFLLARLSMRPVRSLSLVASLRYDDRDNRTRASEFTYVGGDIQLQPLPGTDSDRVRTNLARSRRLLHLGLDASYRLPGARVLQAGWARETTRRTFTEVERSTESSAHVTLRQNGAGPWTGAFTLERQLRRADLYQYNLPFLASYTSQAYIDGLVAANGCLDLADCVRSAVLQRKFYLADRDRDQLRLDLAYTPVGPMALQTRLALNRDGYPKTDYGVGSANGWTIGADLNYLLTRDVTATAFYNLEAQHTVERGRQVTGVVPAAGGSALSDWSNRFADRSATFGFGMRFARMLGGRLAVDVDLLTVRGRTPIATTVADGVTAAQNPAGPFPDLRYRSDGLDLVAGLALDRQSTVKLRYRYRKVRQDDWAYQSLGYDTVPTVVGTGQLPLRRTVHGIGVSFVYTFQ